ncbi:unnamed protein product, partial [Musa hybrid cultivar]
GRERRFQWNSIRVLAGLLLPPSTSRHPFSPLGLRSSSWSQFLMRWILIRKFVISYLPIGGQHR